MEMHDIEEKRNSVAFLLKTKRDEKNNIQNIEIAQKIISEFLNSNFNDIKEFCFYTVISITDFENCVNLIKEKQRSLYDKYLEKINLVNDVYTLKNIESILIKIKNGIQLEDGSFREFNIVDYYRMSNLSFKDFIKIVENNFSIEYLVSFKRFVNNNSGYISWIDASIRNYFNTKILLGVKFDENKKVIPNTGIELSLEEKMLIIDYLKSLGAPINDKTVSIVQREFVKGEIDLKNNFQKKL